jgi:hypothetical protein
MVRRDNLLFLLFGVAAFWFQNKPFAAILTPILLTAATIMSVLHDIPAATFSTCMGYLFADHFLSLLPNHFVCSTTEIFSFLKLVGLSKSNSPTVLGMLPGKSMHA